jgi:hypothetical protein
VCNPLAGARDSRAFRADDTLAVEVGIGEEERVATSDGRLFWRFCRADVLVANIMEKDYPVYLGGFLEPTKYTSLTNPTKACE